MAKSKSALQFILRVDQLMSLLELKLAPAIEGTGQSARFSNFKKVDGRFFSLVSLF